MYKLCRNFLSPEMGNDSVFGRAVRRFPPPDWLCSSQKWGTSSQILARPHTPAHTPVTWTCDPCHKTMNKHSQHTLGISEMHTNKTKTIHTRLEMKHPHTLNTQLIQLHQITHSVTDLWTGPSRWGVFWLNGGVDYSAWMLHGYGRTSAGMHRNGCRTIPPLSLVGSTTTTL